MSVLLDLLDDLDDSSRTLRADERLTRLDRDTALRAYGRLDEACLQVQGIQSDIDRLYPREATTS